MGSILAPAEVRGVMCQGRMKPFHEMTKGEAVELLRSLYYAQPKADWALLAVGNVILHKGRGWRVIHVPPQRGFVMATNVMTGETEKLLRSRYATPDLLVTDEAILALLRVSHQDEIKTALAAGIEHQPARPVRLPRHFHAVSGVVGREAAREGGRPVAADQRDAGVQRRPGASGLAAPQGQSNGGGSQEGHCPLEGVPCGVRSRA